jgi:enoyl-CoA hydratase/carnithine racemase
VTASSNGLIGVAHNDAAVTITLRRPDKKNALSIALRDEISDALDVLAQDESVKVVVFTGAGNVFSAGFDLSEFPRALEDPAYSKVLWDSSDRYHRAVLQFPLPTIAAVNGPALAGGFDLAIMCDIRVSTSTARFAHPEYTFGDVVYAPLHDLVGGAIARELTMTGRPVDADEALAMRLVNTVVAPNELDAAVKRYTDAICAAPREMLMRTKAKALTRAGIAGDTATLAL